MRRLVRKSSEAGRAADKLISGFGSAAGLFFRHLQDATDGRGRAGGSESSEGLRVPSPLSGEFFLDRKRFIVTAALVVYCDSVANRQWYRQIKNIRGCYVSVADC